MAGIQKVLYIRKWVESGKKTLRRRETRKKEGKEEGRKKGRRKEVQVEGRKGER